MSSPVTIDLDSRNIPFRQFTHPGQLHSLQQAAEERGQRPEQVIHSILFRLSSNQFVMELTPGSKRISWPALRQHSMLLLPKFHVE
jgi:Cys-tRNA(Pro)/Cys-tRNA(Cys) deacylase